VHGTIHDICTSVQRRKKSKKAPDSEASGAKQPATAGQPVTVGGEKKRRVLDSLFHEDGEGTKIQETYLCRSVGGRGLHLA
jgi:hypothetical protein